MNVTGTLVLFTQHFWKDVLQPLPFTAIQVTKNLPTPRCTKDKETVFRKTDENTFIVLLGDSKGSLTDRQDNVNSV